LYGWIVVVTFSFLLFSCDNTGACTDAEPVSQLNIRFVKRDTTAKTGKKDTLLTFQRIFSLGATQDFVNAGTKLSKTALDFDPGSDETSFIFDRSANGQTVKDTLVMGYRRQYRVLSPKCPLRVEFTQILLQSHSFDSLYINPNAADENTLEVYFAK
jgi:hypothetical protein